VPKTLQYEYRDPLQKVQRIATAFTFLENISSHCVISDLDVFLDCARIASHLSDERDTPFVDQMSSQLEAAKVVCLGIPEYLLGFTLTLKSAEALKTSTYNNFGKFKLWWDSNRLTCRSNKIYIESAKWRLIRDTVSAFCAVQILADVEDCARRVIHEFNESESERVAKRKAELTAAPWEGCIGYVTISGLSQHRIGKRRGM
jgi:hypothetical protein